MSTHLRSVWPTKRLKYSVAVRGLRVEASANGQPFLGLEHIEPQTGRCILGPESEVIAAEITAQSLANVFRPGDVLFGKLRPYLAKAWVAEWGGLCSTEFVVMQPIGYDARFLRYILLSRDFIDAVDASTFGSKMPRADWDFIGNMAVPIPGRKVQSRIADVLDAETTRLDALITAKERMLRLLDEKRRALITRAVTRGINPDVQMRDSGVSWLGKVPAHWQITRLKFVATVRGGLTLGKDYGQVPTIPLPYLRVANVQDGHIDLENVAVVNVPESEAERYLLAPGDVLMNEGGDADKLGRGTVWNGEISPCLHQNHVFAVRPRAVNSEWLDLWTSSEGAKAYFETRARQSTNLASISSSNIRELPIAVPPEDERMQIVASVRQRSAILDELRASTKQSIDLLKERRNTLIATAVTGQLAIPELTEQSPKEEMACSSTT